MRLSVRALALGVSVAASLAYLLVAKWLPFPMDVVAKGLSVTMLGIVALHEKKSFLASALLLSSLGDVLLDLGRSYFLPGLAAFLASHLVYTVLFARRRTRAATPARQWAFPALSALYGIGFGVWLTPSLAEMRVPVYCYIAAIVAMVATASRANYRSRWVLIGAVLFLISDSLLGTDRFKLRIPWSGLLIWTTYYIGQCGIALGVLSEVSAGQRQD